MFLLICFFLAATAFPQSPSNESRLASGGPTVRTCASELERSTRPATLTEDCLLGIGDVFYVSFWRECAWYPSVIGPDGTVVLPFFGKVQAAKLPVSQLAESIKMLLSEYVNHPSVSVTLVDNVMQLRYFVDGEVLQPGRYLLFAPVTVVEAIDKAEGFKPGANLKIVVQRQGGAMVRVDYKDLLKYPEQNVTVQNGDHIVVSRFR